MFVFSIIAILIMAQLIAYRNERKLADTLGMVCCGFILVLYLFAFFRIMPWIDYIAVPVMIVSMFWIWRNGLAKSLLADFFSIQNICIISALLLITCSQKSRIALSIDDISYWATDIKQMFINDGLAAKYGNVAPEFGYYPPAIQLFRWFFIHVGAEITDQYNEGVGYSGYLCLNFILVLPLISKIDRIVSTKEAILSEEDDNVGVKLSKNKKYYASDKRLVSKYKVKIAGNNSEIVGEKINVVGCFVLILANVIACICLMLLPTVINSMCFEEISAEATVGILYGMLLLFAWDKDREHPLFYFSRLALLGSVLMLCIPMGFCWACLIIIFMVTNLLYDRKGERYNQASLFETNIRYGVYTVLSWLFIGLSWLVFCLITGRFSAIKKIYATNDTVSIGYYLSDKIVEFLKCVAISPLHNSRSWLIDLSVLTCVILLVVFIHMMRKKEIVSESYGKLITMFTVTSIVISYVVVFVLQLTIFSSGAAYSVETDILSLILSKGMPCIMGILILVIGILLMSSNEIDDGRPVVVEEVREQIVARNYKYIRIIYSVVAVFILLCSSYEAYYKGLWKYRDTLEADISEVNSIFDDREEAFVKTVADTSELYGKRLLYLKDASDVRWNHNAYINYKVVPISVEYGTISAEASEEDLYNIIADSNAKYLYIEDIEGIDERLGFVQEWEHVGDQGKAHLFRILDEGKIEPYRETIEK